MSLLLLLLLGCSHSAGDAGLRAEVLALPASDVAGAHERIARMEDVVERGVTVELWIRQNRGRVDMNQALALCRLVQPSELDTCTRHLHALHLNRRDEP